MAGGTRGHDRVRGANLRGAYLVEGSDGYIGVVWKGGRIWYYHRFTEAIATPRQGTATREAAIRELVGE